MRHGLLGTVAVLVLSLGAGQAMADPIVAPDPPLSFNITGSGTYTVDTGDITAATVSKTIPSVETINGIIDGSGTSGLTAGGAANFSVLTFNTVVGAFNFTLTTGDLIFTFDNISSALIVPTGTNTQGSISEQFNGTVTSDTSNGGGGSGFLGQTVSLSETCTQTGAGAAISCSDSLRTPGLPIRTPEPATMAIFGLGLAGLGFMRRRRNKA